MCNDPHGPDGNTTHWYWKWQSCFGEGGVDDAEDADVIIHELGMACMIKTAGGLSQSMG
ncbi:MAG: hypothetical protein R3F53_19485 [Gammaproteobacteria bacterium]